MKVTRQLVLEVERREIPVGTPIQVRVRETSNRPIEGAMVELGSKRHKTDERGLCTIRIQSPGFWKVTASAPATDRLEYRPVTMLIRARPRSALKPTHTGTQGVSPREL